MRAAAPPRVKRPGQAVFLLTLRPEPGTDSIRALRGLLKIALRRFGLRCIAVRELPIVAAPMNEHGTLDEANLTEGHDTVRLS